MRAREWMGAALACTAMLALASAMQARAPRMGPSAESIIQQSVSANQRDWNAAPEYSHSETDNDGHGPKTWQVTMLFGSPYKRLMKVNGKPISAERQKEEQQKFEQAVAQRRSESPSARASRIADYEKGRRRDHLLMEQLSKAFDFRLNGTGRMNGRSVYVLSATPRAGYQPPVMEAQVLTGMRGTLWIDKATSQWVKVKAEVISPVSIEGFLAKVEPGTWFELDKMPVNGDIWLPRHFGMRSHAKVLFLFNDRSSENDTYFDYHKTPPEYLTATK